jgi:ADP-ribose pyrophosphatase
MGKNADAQALLEKQSKIKSHWVYEGKYLKVRQDIIDSPGHPTKIWDIAVPTGAVAIIAIDAQERFILVEQWRRAIGRITLELPAGMIDPGEDPQDCAQRELQEEAGYKARSLKSFGGCYSSPGSYSEYLHLFLGTDLVESRLHAEDTETIDVRAVSLKEALKMIHLGEICDAKTIVGILRYANKC